MAGATDELRFAARISDEKGISDMLRVDPRQVAYLDHDSALCAMN